VLIRARRLGSNDLSQSSIYSLKIRARLQTHVSPALIIDTNGPALRSHSMRSTEKHWLLYRHV
jgi:hypothetical protein